MSKVLLKLNDSYEQILLPNDKGLSTIMAALSKGLVARDKSYGHGKPEILVECAVRISVTYLPPDTKIRKASGAEDEDGPLRLTS